MKNIKYIFFTLLTFVINIFSVYASCTNEEVNLLKDLADDIKITYKHKGIIENEEIVLYNQFDVTVKNMNDDLYILFRSGSEQLIPNNGVINTELSSGKWYFDIYSKKCDVKIDQIVFSLPKFNLYSLDPLCNGIDGNDFPLCGKYYEYDVDYDNFVERVNHYRIMHKIKDESSDKKDVDDNLLQIIFDVFIKYQIYIISFLIVLLIVLVIIIIAGKRKKKGVLE